MLSKFCRGCALWEKKENQEGNPKFMEEDVCDINHFQSSGAMESAGALSFFRESIPKYNVRYSHYIGDGDTESFKKVVDMKPYGDDLVPMNLNVSATFKNVWELVCVNCEILIKARN